MSCSGVINTSILRGVINSFRVGLSLVYCDSGTFQVKVGALLTVCQNTHRNEKDPEVVLLRDYLVKDSLKELVSITRTNKMLLLFVSLLYKNYI